MTCFDYHGHFLHFTLKPKKSITSKFEDNRVRGQTISFQKLLLKKKKTHNVIKPCTTPPPSTLATSLPKSPGLNINQTNICNFKNHLPAHQEFKHRVNRNTKMINLQRNTPFCPINAPVHICQPRWPNLARLQWHPRPHHLL